MDVAKRHIVPAIPHHIRRNRAERADCLWDLTGFRIRRNGGSEREEVSHSDTGHRRPDEPRVKRLTDAGIVRPDSLFIKRPAFTVCHAFETQPHFALPKERNGTDPEQRDSGVIPDHNGFAIRVRSRHHNAKLREHGSRRAKEVGGIVIPRRHHHTAAASLKQSRKETVIETLRLVGWHRDIKNVA